MLSDLDKRKIRCLDGLHYSYGLLAYYHPLIYTACCKILENRKNVVVAIAACWGFVDALHRIREIAQSVPGLNQKSLEMRTFISETELTEIYRHYIQHLRGEIAKPQSNPFPLWGSLSWIDPAVSTRMYVALLGARLKGVEFTGSVYDNQEKKWLSRASLGLGSATFNFDPQYEAAVKFQTHVIKHILESTPAERPPHNELPIVQYDLRATEDGGGYFDIAHL